MRADFQQLAAGLARRIKMVKFLSWEGSPLLAAESFNFKIILDP